MNADRIIRVPTVSRVVGAFLSVLAAILLLPLAVLAQDTIPATPQVIPDAILSWQFIVTVIAPPLLTAVLARPDFSSRAKTGMMVGFSIVAVVFGMFLRSELQGATVNDWIAIILAACVASAAFYQGLQKPFVNPGNVGIGAG